MMVADATSAHVEDLQQRALTSGEAVGTALPVDGAPNWWRADLIRRVAACLPPNEVAVHLRLVDHIAASALSGPEHTTIHLSQPVPAPDFYRRWAPPGACRSLTLQQRRRLACLTAASGSIDNLRTLADSPALAAACPLEPAALAAAAAAGHLSDGAAAPWLLSHLRTAAPSAEQPWNSQTLPEVAAAGRLDAVAWLRDAGCPWGSGAFASAAGSGSSQLVAWLRRHACPLGATAPLAASAAGHDTLAEELWFMRAPSSMAHMEVQMLWNTAAAGGLAAVQRWWARLVEGGGKCGSATGRAALLAQAAGARSGDWKAKVQWLLDQGCGREEQAITNAALCADGAARVAWLRQRGFRVGLGAVQSAASRGDLPLMLELLRDLEKRQQQQEEHRGQGTGAAGSDGTAASAGKGGAEAAEAMAEVADAALRHGAVVAAAEGGSLGCLQALVRRGWMRRGSLRNVLDAAARSGHVDLVAWLCDHCTDPQLHTAAGNGAGARVPAAGPGVGSSAGVEALVGSRLLEAAAASGSTALLRHLLCVRRCPGSVAAFRAAAAVGCEEQLELMAEAGCPMGEDGEAYEPALWNNDLATLRCLRRLGCRWRRPQPQLQAGGSGGAGDAGTAPSALRSLNYIELALSVGSLPVLQWLHAQGLSGFGPVVDWGRLAEEARQRVTAVEGAGGGAGAEGVSEGLRRRLAWLVAVAKDQGAARGGAED
eukprot:XP_001698325.1 predicted protein [Chlamydomonas reinhardtii]